MLSFSLCKTTEKQGKGTCFPCTVSISKFWHRKENPKGHSFFSKLKEEGICQQIEQLQFQPSFPSILGSDGEFSTFVELNLDYKNGCGRNPLFEFRFTDKQSGKAIITLFKLLSATTPALLSSPGHAS